jgi:hypothetical protein
MDIVPDSPSQTSSVPIVTLRTLFGPGGVEAMGLKAATDTVPKQVVERYNRLLQKLEEETGKTSSEVLITLQDRDTSVLQSRIAEGGVAGPPLAAGGVEAQFGEGLTGGDVWGWIGSVFDHIDKNDWHPIARPIDHMVATLEIAGHRCAEGDWRGSSPRTVDCARSQRKIRFGRVPSRGCTLLRSSVDQPHRRFAWSGTVQTAVPWKVLYELRRVAGLPRQAHMPIRPYLDGARFDRETIHIMGVAFGTAREALYLANRDDLANDVIANRIIDLAKAG